VVKNTIWRGEEEDGVHERALLDHQAAQLRLARGDRHREARRSAAHDRRSSVSLASMRADYRNFRG
jgi:hypothetical protein